MNTRSLLSRRLLAGAFAAAAAFAGFVAAPTSPAAAAAPADAHKATSADATCWATHYGSEIPPGSFTSSGEVFDRNALTAATSLSRNPQLPFGTLVKVTNVANGASVTVRINDRGTFTSPVCLDLTDGAFSRLAALSPDPGHIVVTEQIVSSSGTSGPIRGIDGKCVDVAGANTADGTAVQLYDCNGTGAQHWTLSGDGTVRALGKCLDVSGGSTADGAKTQLWDCNGTGAQRWQHQADGELVNPQSGKCLDAIGNSSANGTRLQIWGCAGTPNQRWSLPS
ncbi:lectin [Streptomyces sp. NPDC001796]|uniref:lectin n=1 Tax=Streptomyces sp. NPDC001796 TaxID=3364609 RepID=UPI003696407F